MKKNYKNSKAGKNIYFFYGNRKANFISTHHSDKSNNNNNNKDFDNKKKFVETKISRKQRLAVDKYTTGNYPYSKALVDQLIGAFIVKHRFGTKFINYH